jgi:superoxide dismutase, Cu-Zn family
LDQLEQQDCLFGKNKGNMKAVLSTTLIVGTLILAGCSTTNTKEADTSKPMGSKARPMAVAVLSPAQGKNVSGQVTFLKETEGVRVTAKINGLTPGKHGFHIHEKGDCSAADFSSAGGHFNPAGSPHGAPTSPQHHVGDFGNLEANAEGVAQFEQVLAWLTFEGTNSIIGRAVIVHEKADDLTTQPTGNAGGRWACGVIQAVHH